MFNPKVKEFLEKDPDKTIVKEFLEKDPDKTMLSFSWSLYWRLYAVIFGVCIIAGIIGALLD